MTSVSTATGHAISRDCGSHATRFARSDAGSCMSVFSPVDGKKPQRRAHQGRLARAVRPDQAHDLARADAERGVVDHRAFAAPHRDPFERQERHASCLRVL
jgi:hypothetical protein